MDLTNKAIFAPSLAKDKKGFPFFDFKGSRSSAG